MKFKKSLSIFCIAFILSSTTVFADNGNNLPYALKSVSSSIIGGMYENEIIVAFKNDVTPTENNVLFVCIYDYASNSFEKAITINLNENIICGEKIRINPKFHTDGKKHKVKAFVWNFKNITPLSNVVTCDYPSNEHGDGSSSNGGTSSSFTVKP